MESEFDVWGPLRSVLHGEEPTAEQLAGLLRMRLDGLARSYAREHLRRRWKGSPCEALTSILLSRAVLWEVYHGWEVHFAEQICVLDHEHVRAHWVRPRPDLDGVIPFLKQATWGVDVGRVRLFHSGEDEPLRKRLLSLPLRDSDQWSLGERIIGEVVASWWYDHDGPDSEQQIPQDPE